MAIDMKELQACVEYIKVCDKALAGGYKDLKIDMTAALTGANAPQWLREIAKEGAQQAVRKQRQDMIDRLKDAGVPIIDEGV